MEAEDTQGRQASLTGARWRLGDVSDAQVERLTRQLGVHEALARCLALRGVEAADEALKLLHPELDALYDPQSLLGMDVAIDRLRRASRDGERVRVVTDYDVDGTTSSLILQSALRAARATREPNAPDLVSYHIPDRMDEGYGFSVTAAEQAARDGATLIVTADIGVRDHAAVSRARELGLDVIICDHHLSAGDEVPADATAVICPPQRGCSYPNKDLAACGVTFKLAQALLDDHPRRDTLLRSLLKLAALGTVADVVSLRGAENRAIVAMGLDALNAGGHSPGLTALLKASRVTVGQLRAEDLAFRVAPRVNAAGRVATARAVIELFTTRDVALAESRAMDLDALNDERRRIQERMMKEAQSQLQGQRADPPCVVVWGREAAGWHRGVAGIVAARLRDQHNAPAVVLALGDGGEARASVRSTPDLHALTLLGDAQALLLKWGGHAAAAGFSARSDDVPALAAMLLESATARLGERAPQRCRTAELRLPPQALSMGLVEALAQLEPHGKDNPEPKLWVTGARLTNLRVVKDRHLMGDLAGAGPRPVSLVWWDGAPHRAALAAAPSVELLGKLGVNSWQGVDKLQIQAEDALIGEG